MGIKKIVVVGSCNTDMVVKSDRLPVPGETVLGGAFMMNPGGKGANQAVAVARLGGNATFITKTGNDLFGKQSIEMFDEENINTDNILSDPLHPSGVALIMVDNNGENCIVVASGANASLSTHDIEKARDVIESADIILMQLEIPMNTVEYAAKMAFDKGIKVILNPAPAAFLSNELMKCLYAIVPNKTEAEILSDFNNFVKLDIEKSLATYRDDDETLSDFADYTLDRFKEYSENAISDVSNIVFENIVLNADIRPLIDNLYWRYFKSFNFTGQETGLVFGGYGEKQIYPSVSAIRISEVIDNRLRHQPDKSDEISDFNTGSILPYAQTDVIDMFIRGIDPYIESTYISAIEKTLTKHNTAIADIIGASNQPLSDAIRNNDNNPILKELIDEIRKINNNLK